MGFLPTPSRSSVGVGGSVVPFRGAGAIFSPRRWAKEASNARYVGSMLVYLISYGGSDSEIQSTRTRTV